MAALGTAPAFAAVPPILVITDASVNEGNAGQTSLVFTVSLQGPADQPVSAEFALPTPLTGTGFNPATRGAFCTAGTDFAITQPIPVNFAAGASPAPVTISVPVCGDTAAEPDEQMFVNLTHVSNAQCLEGTCNGVGTIRDDDGAPRVTMASASAREPLSGTAKMTFTVTLAHTSSSEVSVNYATQDVTARSTNASLGNQPVTCPFVDYFSKSGVLKISPGSPSGTIEVTICSDKSNEGSETFTLHLTNPVNGTLGSPSATGTILNFSLPALGG
jgi:hypothetical protein